MATIDHDGFALEHPTDDERARCKDCGGLLYSTTEEQERLCETCAALRDLHEVNDRLQASAQKLSGSVERMEHYAREFSGVRQ